MTENAPVGAPSRTHTPSATVWTPPRAPLMRMLLLAAQAASRVAYAPYSHFAVGAAVLEANGRVWSGCNVENASYGLTICAERNAVFQMASVGGRRITDVVIYTPTATPSAPCGACRQVLNEFGPTAHVLCQCDGPDVIDTTVDALLPLAFGPANLQLAGHPAVERAGAALCAECAVLRVRLDALLEQNDTLLADKAWLGAEITHLKGQLAEAQAAAVRATKTQTPAP